MKLSIKKFPKNTAKRELQSWIPVQVAAVCYRRTEFSVQFLLVKTSSGKWTFPKGRIDPEHSPSEAAAQEAREEAGVRGRIEEDCFDRYMDLKRTLGHDNKSREVLIEAFLLEVRSLSSPEESGRNPTWFSPDQAKQRLAEGRAPRYSREISGIVDSALHNLSHPEQRSRMIAEQREARLTTHR
jgi:8-oxo-dGTP pyrophosphatase MutT (NUDIX family)